MKIKWLLSIIISLSVNCFSQITFQEEILTSQNFLLNDAKSVFASDLDGDGDMDVISASSFDNKIAWYENTDGLGGYATPKTITLQATGARSVFASDIDGDGDMDVISASLFDNDIAWYENTDGLGNFSSLKIISVEGNNARSVFASDIDGDGDMDVISASNQRVAWYENTDGLGNFSSQKIISTSISGGYSVKAIDIDDDGDMDVISASAFDSKIAWYENTDGLGNFSSQKIIGSDIGWVYSIDSNDIDNDGDVDIVYTSFTTGKIAWYENIDGLGTFSSEQVISNLDEAKSVYSADVDNDGDFDILSISDNKTVWYENTNSDGTFGTEQIISSNNGGNSDSIYAIDIDGDNDLDIISDTFNNIIWHENTDNQGTYGEGTPIVSSTQTARSAFATDLDGDGDLDILCSSEEDDKVSWFENLDGQGNFGIQKIIASTNGPVEALAADIDGDNDMDIVVTAHNSNRTFWQENLDGLGNFGTPKNIVVGTGFNTSIYMSDIDNDGDLDLLSDASWYENTDGMGTFGSEQVITHSVSQLYYTYASDIDGDGDMDVLTASAQDNKIAWYENTDAQGTFGSQQIISNQAIDATYVITADLDGDNDLDVISASFGDKKIAWYENLDGQGTFGPQQIVFISPVNTGALSLFASDIDNDGDIDILSASPSNNMIAWYENIDAEGTFGNQHIISSDANGAVYVHASDIDNNGKIDVLSASFSDNKIAWYRNTSSILNVNNYSSKRNLIYPNPTNNFFYIQSEKIVRKMFIYDMSGQLINKSFNKNSMDISSLSLGIYVLKVEDEDGIIKEAKVIKR